MALFLRGPEIVHREAVLQVGAEVVHPADGEEDVHSELGGGCEVWLEERLGLGLGFGWGRGRRWGWGWDQAAYFEDFKVRATEGAEYGRHDCFGCLCKGVGARHDRGEGGAEAENGTLHELITG